jgi:hypothetical protein
MFYVYVIATIFNVFLAAIAVGLSEPGWVIFNIACGAFCLFGAWEAKRKQEQEDDIHRPGH